MIDIRTPARQDHGWLNSQHHFSFADYHDPQRMGLGALRVWNDDEIAAQTGFGMHPHRDMEIITYVRTGAITHRDSLGNVGRTEAGDVQVMHAGTGITHSEQNDEAGQTTLFQIWIVPNRRGVAPGWQARVFPRDGSGLRVLASGFGDAGALPLYADGALSAGLLRRGDTIRQPLAAGRAAYLVPAIGAVTVNGQALATRQGAAITDEAEIEITATDDAELVLVEVAA